MAPGRAHVRTQGLRTHEFTSDLLVPRPPESVFPFFAEAANLETITPPWLSFTLLTPRPIAMHVGARIEYRIRIHGVPVRWRTEITAFEPPHRFVDEQVAGPYRLWVHEHRFVRVEGGTRCEDHVRYALRGGPLAPLLHRLFVRRDIERIFAYRALRLREVLGAPPPHASLAPQRVEGRGQPR